MAIAVFAQRTPVVIRAKRRSLSRSAWDIPPSPLYRRTTTAITATMSTDSCPRIHEHPPHRKHFFAASTGVDRVTIRYDCASTLFVLEESWNINKTEKRPLPTMSCATMHIRHHK